MERVSEELDLDAQLRIAVGRLNRRIRAEKASDELSDGQFSVLALLYREGPHTVGELAEAERVTPPSMNRRVNSLVEGGYVTREGSPDDGRKVIVRVTDAGAAFVTETRRRREHWLNKRTRALTAAQRETLRQASVIMKELADS
ncbi:MarR family winged helix-turn-helix transcriptional regulator [Gryllotalpicola ginsengisoli]|uniref:MarR family winged helix-turn-helix transcriptional regulator n=1 Tax=Gryllotalpicola ginsengisoli TaxID=444608 RepID=UPI0003B622F3|nr:MarR family transcriptional regulator [Gryllotalpicola ginsengisoli]